MTRLTSSRWLESVPTNPWMRLWEHGRRNGRRNDRRGQNWGSRKTRTRSAPE